MPSSTTPNAKYAGLSATKTYGGLQAKQKPCNWLKSFLSRAGPRGFEPRSTVLETGILPLNYRPLGVSVAKKLLSRLFVGLLYPAPLTILFELDFALNKLLVFGRPIVNALAFPAGQLYETVL